MKFTITISIFLFSLFSFGQGEHPFFQTGFDWKNWDINLTVREKRKIVKHAEFSICSIIPKRKDVGKSSSNWHFMDFDGDSLTDIVYTGPYPEEKAPIKRGIEKKDRCSPLNIVAFFRNSGEDYFEFVAGLNGEITMMQRLHGKNQGVQFVILTPPCWSDIAIVMRQCYFGGKINFTPQSDRHINKPEFKNEYNSDRGVNLVLEQVYTTGLYFPEALMSRNFRTGMDTTFLLQKPGFIADSLMNENKNSFPDLTTYDNKATARVPPGIDCVGIGYKIANGIPYFLVMIDNESLVNNYLEGYPGYQLGWIDSRYLIGKEQWDD